VTTLRELSARTTDKIIDDEDGEHVEIYVE